MVIVCIIGRSGCGKSEVEAKLAKLGYNRSISYTTKKPGKGEVNGVHYHFVTEEDFLKLVEKNIIMEHTEYVGNYYGSPHPIGTINNVLVVEPSGYESIRNIYGKQVVGVYLDVPVEVAEQRAANRDRTDQEDIKKRRDNDDLLFRGIKDKVDLVIDAQQDIETTVAEILKYISDNRR